MNELIQIKKDEAVCTSLDVAEKFCKRHDRVIRSIENIQINLPKNGVVKMFIKSTYEDAKGEKRPMYYMTRDGFSLLVMGFTGKDALEWKIKYIEAFNKMESILNEKKTAVWVESRKNGMITRKSETDSIKDFIDYAVEQGSKHPDKYYINFSKLANKICGIRDRDIASVFQLNNLSLVERIIMITIRNGIAASVPYKDIYQNCKKACENFSDAAYLQVNCM